MHPNDALDARQRSRPLDGRVALITGAGGAIGRVLTVALAEAGAAVVATSTHAAFLDETVAACPPHTRPVAVLGDVSRPDEIDHLVAQATTLAGPVDILVNNAGVGPQGIASDGSTPRPFWHVDRDELVRTFMVNSTAPFVLAQLVAPGMIERGWGRIINVTTSLPTMLKYAAYGASKAALEAHTACMARDLAGTGVTANVLIPGGATASRMTAGEPAGARALLSADLMSAPATWLSSVAADAVNGCRVVASEWEPPTREVAAGVYPVAWSAPTSATRSAPNP